LTILLSLISHPFSTSILNILDTGLLILGTEVLGAIPGEPCAEFADFFLETLDRLRIHVRLSNQFRHIDYFEGQMLAARRDRSGDEKV
jgi:hypothetical protein